MPLGCMNRGVGLKIGGSVGEVKEVVVAEDNVGWEKCLWIKVAIDLYQPLDRGCALHISRKSCWVPFKYEKLSAFCYKCKRILHGLRGCSEKDTKKLSHEEGF